MLKWFRLRSFSSRNRLEDSRTFSRSHLGWQQQSTLMNQGTETQSWSFSFEQFVVEPSSSEDRALRWAGRGHRMQNSGQCLTTQLNNEASTCSWLDEQETSMAACCRGLELDRELHVMLRSNKRETGHRLIISGLRHKKWQAQANGRQVMKLKMKKIMYSSVFMHMKSAFCTTHNMWNCTIYRKNTEYTLKNIQALFFIKSIINTTGLRAWNINWLK